MMYLNECLSDKLYILPKIKRLANKYNIEKHKKIIITFNSLLFEIKKADNIVI